jgi:hypothetical protein
VKRIGTIATPTAVTRPKPSTAAPSAGAAATSLDHSPTPSSGPARQTRESAAIPPHRSERGRLPRAEPERSGRDPEAVGPETGLEDREVLGETRSERSDRSAVDDEEGEPAREEPDERMKGLAEVDVVAAGVRERRTHLRVRERPSGGDQAAQEPGHEQPDRIRHRGGDQSGRREDPHPDDAPRDDHRRVEEPEF